MIYYLRYVLLLFVFGAIIPESEAQKKVPLVSNSDSVISVKVIKADTNIIYPKLKQPLSLCSEMQQAWRRYLKEHPTAEKEFNFKSDSGSYYVSFSFVINRFGQIVDWDDKTYHSNVKKIYDDAFKNSYLRSNWSKPYEKLKNNNKETVISAVSNFNINKNGISQFEITDSKTGETFYSCL